MPRKQSVPLGFLRVIVLTIRQFRKDNCQLRASALTYYFLMSIVPVLAMMFGIAKGFGLEDKLRDSILRELPSQEVVLTRVIELSGRMLEKTRGDAIAGVGVVFLIWTIIKMLEQIESAFNDIWGVTKSKPLSRKFTDYLALMIICPIALVISGSVSVFLAGLAVHPDFLFLPEFILKLLVIFLPLLSFGVVCGILSFLYVSLPNTTVRVPSAVIGAFAAAVSYQLVQWGYIHAQIFFSGFGAVYGSFAALPLFLLWLQLSWTVVLLGAEIAFAHQNVDTYEFEPEALQTSFLFQKRLALCVVSLCAERFRDGQKPPTDEEISDTFEIPSRLCRNLIERLIKCGILSEVRREGSAAPAYQPAMPIESITYRKVLEGLDNLGVDSIPVADSESSRAFGAKLNQMSLAMAQGGANEPIVRTHI
jgi:membrane protein